MGKLFFEDEYGTIFLETIENPPIALIDDINKTIQYRAGFLDGCPFYSDKQHYDWTEEQSNER